MLRETLIGACILCVAASSAAHAQGATQTKMTYPILGVGAKSCGFWTSSRALTDSPLDAAVSSWLLGYVTASNVMANIDTQRSGGLTEGMDNDAVLAWVDNYCKANPLDKIADASIKLLKELMRRRIDATKGSP